MQRRHAVLAPIRSRVMYVVLSSVEQEANKSTQRGRGEGACHILTHMAIMQLPQHSSAQADGQESGTISASVRGEDSGSF
jgi:hypothetical protein